MNMLQRGDISCLDSNAGSIVLRPLKKATSVYIESFLIPYLNVTVNSVPGVPSK